MTRTTAQAEFGQWIENRRWFREEELAFSVALAGEHSACADVGRGIAAHLANTDPAAPGGWLYFDGEMLERIATRTGIEALARAFPEIGCRAHFPCQQRRCSLLGDVARIGGAVFTLPEQCADLRQHPALFVASLSAPGGDLAIDLDRLGVSTAIRVIADSALEWAQSRNSSSEQESPISLWKS